MIKNIVANFTRYQFLMRQLISRDFKVKYKRSVLGVVWSLLYPVLMMLVMAVVFSKMFRFSVPGVNYFVYFEVGFIMFNYFSEATNNGMTSVVYNFNLLTKVYIPKYIFPLSKCLFCGINFLLTLIPLFFVIVFTGTIQDISWYYLLLPVIFFFGFLFTVGVSFALSTVSVFFRDMFYIYGIILTIWNYATPVFYDISIIPATLQTIFKFNPLYSYINSAREIILFGRCPATLDLIFVVLYGILAVIIGAIIFKRHQDKFIYYA